LATAFPDLDPISIAPIPKFVDHDFGLGAGISLALDDVLLQTSNGDVKFR
jgi:hypothetical protein